MSFIGQTKFVNLSIICPKDGLTIQKMQACFFWDGERWFSQPCNGCEEMTGADVCTKCKAGITNTLFRSPEVDLSTPLNPSAE